MCDLVRIGGVNSWTLYDFGVVALGDCMLYVYSLFFFRIFVQF